jgi:hypothetical protein
VQRARCKLNPLCLLHLFTIDAHSLLHTQGVRIEYKDDPENPIRAVRGTGIIHATAEIIRLHLVQIDLRQYWDPYVRLDKRLRWDHSNSVVA